MINKTVSNTFRTLGTSTHTAHDREVNDYYATDPIAAKFLIELENFKDSDILEVACGEGHLSKVMEENGLNVTSIDIVDRGYPGTIVLDFLSDDINNWHGHIVTNPPYKDAQKFIEKSLSIIPEGRKVAMFLKLQFLEGKARKEFYKNNPPKTVYVSSSRIMCAKNGDFDTLKKSGGSAVAYAWFVWEKGFQGDTIIKWFN